MMQHDDEDWSSNDPFLLFRRWYAEARADTRIHESSAMTLATASLDGRPSARVVLLKGEGGSDGFVFYTNYMSKKAAELAENPFAALCFYWMPLGKQIRINGRVERLSAEESDAYFASRPRASQIGAWASQQSAACTAEQLRERVQQYELKFSRGPVPRPEYWGGYRLIAERIEFWLAQEFRLNIRHCFERKGGAGAWQRQQLFP